ncbi:SAUR family [Musa troglodytarum]|uniref:SAUR family n=1 Tax=Musa troglodytarum TaxID=320322 RepID=A0A9E7GHI3_9LILI|nr:SAUR family [Musa troglodytarum]
MNTHPQRRRPPRLSSLAIPPRQQRMIRRLSRVVDCAQYGSLRRSGEGRRHGEPAQGRFPVYVGEEMERFEVRTDLLGRPAFVQLLRLSADEYGYEQRGVLRIPCPAPLFRRLLAAASSSSEEEEKEKELLRCFPELLQGSSDVS